jgi:hypothetical protein
MVSSRAVTRFSTMEIIEITGTPRSDGTSVEWVRPTAGSKIGEETLGWLLAISAPSKQ